MATVPIVTEVTKAQLDALVAANGLDEGLQYKVTDKEGWLIYATSANTYDFYEPYYVYCALISQSGENAPTAIIRKNTFTEPLVWSRAGTGIYYLSCNQFKGQDGDWFKASILPIATGNSLRAYGLRQPSPSSIELTTFQNYSFGYADGLLSMVYFEVRRYKD